MKKTVAIPAKFLHPVTRELRQNLTEAEQQELQKFGDIPLTEDEVAAIEAEQAAREAAELAERPARLTAHLAEYAWRDEVSGTEYNGLPLRTDRDAQLKIMLEEQSIARGERPDGAEWKFADNVERPVSNEEFPLMASAVRSHVKRRHSAESVVLKLIRSGEIQDEQASETAYDAAKSMV